MANSKPTAPTPIRKRLRASALWYPALATATSYTEARQVPLLRLSGDWLAAAGFSPGGEYDVEVAPGRIVLTPV